MLRRPLVLPALWALVILVLCGIPGHDLPHVSFLELLQFDKWVHAGIFFILGILLIRGFRLLRKASIFRHYPDLMAVACGMGYGGLLEILQGTIFVDRSADLYDFIANTFGCVMAMIFYPPLSKRIKFLQT